MIAVETNILVYAHREDSPFHLQASTALDELASGTAPWAIPWPCIHEFFSVATHPKIYSPASTLPEAFDQIEAWIASPTLALLAETRQHWPTLRTLLMAGQIVGPRVHDARIAALCKQHGVTELWSADRDFNRFAGIKVVNPLVRGH